MQSTQWVPQATESHDQRDRYLSSEDGAAFDSRDATLIQSLLATPEPAAAVALPQVHTHRRDSLATIVMFASIDKRCWVVPGGGFLSGGWSPRGPCHR